MKKLVIIILTILVAIAVVLIIGIKRYIDKTPVLSQKPHTIYAEVGETLTINQLADIENAEHISISYFESDTDMSAVISDDKQNIMVGYNTGTLRVTITAQGSNAESRDITVEVYVSVA